MTRRYGYVQADVFTRRPFGGNQLAVFPDARGLATAEMQTIAREMNFSETTFVLPPEIPEAARRVRIFTPGIEVPMTGHPTVGTTWVLARRGVLPGREATLQLGIGAVQVAIDDGFVWMTHRAPIFGPVRDDREAVARALGVAASDLADGRPIQEVSTGVPFLIVPLRSLDAIGRCRSDETALRALGPVSVYPFTTETVACDALVHVRMFSPHVASVPEDPATGSAAAPMGAYAARYGLLPRAAETRFMIEQGLEMHRPSDIHVEVRRDGDAITGLRIGGETVIVAEGEMFW